MEHCMKIIVVLAIYLRLSNCADKLDFWVRDPKFDITTVAAKNESSPETSSASVEENYEYESDHRRSVVKHDQQTIDSYSKDSEEKEKRDELAQIGLRRSSNNTSITGNISTGNDSVLREGDEEDERLIDEPIRRYFKPHSLLSDLEELFTEYKKEANITFEVIGKTISFNDIVLLKIVEPKSETSQFFRTQVNEQFVDDNDDKKIVFIVHALSAMGSSLLPCLSVPEHFLTLVKYYFKQLDKFDIYLMPLANPDGFNQNMIGVRGPYTGVPSMPWNKNTSPQQSCIGVALDRNFDVGWHVAHSISSCSQQYPGSRPFSEAETQAIRNVLHKFASKLVAYIHVHASTPNVATFKGDAILYPKGYTEVTSEDDKYLDMKGEIEEAMRNASFKVLSVEVDTLYNWYGLAPGSSADYASTIYGIPFAMEWLMQVYDDDFDAGSKEKESYVSLTELWGVTIDVVFKNINKYLLKPAE